MKVAAAAGITFNFGLSTVKKVRISSMESSISGEVIAGSWYVVYPTASSR
jgi:hypothetical protein